MGERFISMPESRTHPFGFWIGPQGKKKLLRECLMSSYPTNWVVGSKGIFYADSTSNPAAVAFYEFSSTRVTRRFPIERQFDEWGGLALSPDETWTAYSESDTRGTDLMLADGVQ